jgi:hypothetical protein
LVSGDRGRCRISLSLLPFSAALYRCPTFSYSTAAQQSPHLLLLQAPPADEQSWQPGVLTLLPGVLPATKTRRNGGALAAAPNQRCLFIRPSRRPAFPNTTPELLRHLLVVDAVCCSSWFPGVGKDLHIPILISFFLVSLSSSLHTLRISCRVY